MFVPQTLLDDVPNNEITVEGPAGCDLVAGVLTK